jgi:type IV pilus assembly protein PilV
MRRTGFTLLEVLVALLVFSLGMLGMAGLLTVSVRTNHSAYLRTQATFLAGSIADRMRANMIGIWQGNYDLNSISTPPTAPASAANTATIQDCESTYCSSSEVATRDLQVWQNELNDFLPSAGAAIKCTNAVAASSMPLDRLPPYNGVCEVQISWTKSNIPGQTGTDPEIFDWVFQP